MAIEEVQEQSADTPMTVVVKHITAPLPMPRSLTPAIPEAVECGVLNALAKDPEDRIPQPTPCWRCWTRATTAQRQS